MNRSRLPSDALRATRVLVIITGGTICMRAGATVGLSMSDLECYSLKDTLERLPVFADPCLPDFEVLEWPELVDSSDIEAKHWVKIGEQIVENYNQYDGFVVLHGTDTLAYTASALSFLFEDNSLSKTIVVTGSMLPLAHMNSDAQRNITISMLVAANSMLHEVVVCFGTRILRGNRVVKVNCNVLDPFDTPNYPHLGSVGIDITMNKILALSQSSSDFGEVQSHKPVLFTNLMTAHVCVIRVTPAFDPSILYHLADHGKKPFGIILQLYGTGTAPSNDILQQAVQYIIKAGVTVVAVTQCSSGTCSLRTYANGLRLHQLGAIEGKDLTTEAAFVKLGYLFGKGYTGDELRTLMERDLRGELCETVQCIIGQSNLGPIEVSPSQQAECSRHLLRSSRPARA